MQISGRYTKLKCILTISPPQLNLMDDKIMKYSSFGYASPWTLTALTPGRSTTYASPERSNIGVPCRTTFTLGGGVAGGLCHKK